ncbi:hypothetical protein PCE1_003184 [Barthelona sp. PCE]
MSEFHIPRSHKKRNTQQKLQDEGWHIMTDRRQKRKNKHNQRLRELSKQEATGNPYDVLGNDVVPNIPNNTKGPIVQAVVEPEVDSKTIVFVEERKQTAPKKNRSKHKKKNASVVTVSLKERMGELNPDIVSVWIKEAAEQSTEESKVFYLVGKLQEFFNQVDNDEIINPSLNGLNDVSEFSVKNSYPVCMVSEHIFNVFQTFISETMKDVFVFKKILDTIILGFGGKRNPMAGPCLFVQLCLHFVPELACAYYLTPEDGDSIFEQLSYVSTTIGILEKRKTISVASIPILQYLIAQIAFLDIEIAVSVTFHRLLGTHVEISKVSAEYGEFLRKICNTVLLRCRSSDFPAFSYPDLYRPLLSLLEYECFEQERNGVLDDIPIIPKKWRYIYETLKTIIVPSAASCHMLEAMFYIIDENKRFINSLLLGDAIAILQRFGAQAYATMEQHTPQKFKGIHTVATTYASRILEQQGCLRTLYTIEVAQLTAIGAMYCQSSGIKMRKMAKNPRNLLVVPASKHILQIANRGVYCRLDRAHVRPFLRTLKVVKSSIESKFDAALKVKGYAQF